jgi:hypothetical protein
MLRDCSPRCFYTHVEPCVAGFDFCVLLACLAQDLDGNKVMGLLDSPLWIESTPLDGTGLVNMSEQTRRVILGSNATGSLQASDPATASEIARSRLIWASCKCKSVSLWLKFGVYALIADSAFSCADPLCRGGGAPRRSPRAENGFARSGSTVCRF